MMPVTTPLVPSKWEQGPIDGADARKFKGVERAGGTRAIVRGCPMPIHQVIGSSIAPDQTAQPETRSI
ncbi:hypothetical protein MPLDJ20_320014 [Mesorhizobium plurifarium]|uniref:Uncharacterized protein n=1 Tax=Mesorhizobium plurifarium TaxID=69974 RepID=A0A090FB18_MESPL|nr:hypothetical protein MPLDJ20_320014 [Mesorhizobium plurifarium]CDX61659.1 hypothetical protein MPL3365_70015 [Mesorhizobium plurifarium]